jgi:hypothetical protein
MNNRRIPNRPASRESYKPKQEQKESALDFFKDTWNKREAFANDTKTVSTEEYLASLSVKNTYGTGWQPVRNTTKQLPLKDLMTSGLNEVKVITNTGDVSVSISACNRVEKIETYSNTLEYANCVKVVENTESKYDMKRRNNYKVYDLYRYDRYADRDLVNMTIAVK